MDQAKFQDMHTTARGEQRASVSLKSLKTIWFNTGTLCNLECANCYIESSPKNDRLSYLDIEDIIPYLKEIESEKLDVKLIGLTGGEPFLNPSIISIIKTILSFGLELLILTNANRVIKKHEQSLLEIKEKYRDKLHIRVSLDHFTREIHERERGQGSFKKTLDQLSWLYKHGFNISIASRALVDETHKQSLEGHTKLLEDRGINLDLIQKMVIFPEMQGHRDVPEITTQCWGILGKSPEELMCATERMIVKRKGDPRPVVMPCTLLAYDERFILGATLHDAKNEVFLNHRFCAEFCVLGGASCSGTK